MRGLIGMSLLWGGYSLSLYGWCLLQGYAITLYQLVNPVIRWTALHGVTPAQNGFYTWPPGGAGSTVVIPGSGGAGPVTVQPDGSVG